MAVKSSISGKLPNSNISPLPSLVVFHPRPSILKSTDVEVAEENSYYYYHPSSYLTSQPPLLHVPPPLHVRPAVSSQRQHSQSEAQGREVWMSDSLEKKEPFLRSDTIGHEDQFANPSREVSRGHKHSKVSSEKDFYKRRRRSIMFWKKKPKQRVQKAQELEEDAVELKIDSLSGEVGNLQETCTAILEKIEMCCEEHNHVAKGVEQLKSELLRAAETPRVLQSLQQQNSEVLGKVEETHQCCDRLERRLVCEGADSEPPLYNLLLDVAAKLQRMMEREQNHVELQLKSRDKEIQLLKATKSELKSRVESKDARLQAEERIKERKEQQLQQANNEIKRLHHNVMQLEAKLKAKEQFQRDTDKMMKGKAAELQRIEKDLEAKNSDFKRHQQQSKLHSKMLEQQVEQLKQQVEQLKKQLKGKVEDAQRLQQQVERLQTKLDDKTEEVVRVQQHAVQEGAKLKGMIQSLEQQSSIQQLNSNIQQQTVAQLEAKLSGKEEELRTFKERCTKLEARCVRAEKNSASHQNKCSELQVRLADKEQVIAGLRWMESYFHSLHDCITRLSSQDAKQLQPSKKKEQAGTETVHIGRTVDEDVEVQEGESPEKSLQQFTETYTNPGLVLGVLEQRLKKYDAKRLLSSIYQRAYEASKARVLNIIMECLMELFKYHPPTAMGDSDVGGSDVGINEKMDYTSRAYAMLLKASGLKYNAETHVADVTTKVIADLSKCELYQKVATDLKADPSHLQTLVMLAWDFVVRPWPVVVCQPMHLDEDVDMHSHWNDTLRPDEYELQYTVPVVYRCCLGPLARRGKAGNAPRMQMNSGETEL